MTRPLRILHVLARYWPARGGAESYLHEISRRLAAEGHIVTVVTTDALDVEVFWDPARRRLAEREGDEAGVHIRRFPIRHLPGSPLAYAAWRYYGLRGLAALPLPVMLLARLARYTPWAPDLHQWLAATDEPFDIVGSAGILYEPFVEAGLRLASRRQIPLVAYPFTHLGAGDQPGKDAVGRFYTMRQQVGLVLQAQAVVAMTPTESDYYVQRGLPAGRACSVGAGVTPAAVLGGDAARFRARYPGHDFIVAFIGAMTYDKGVFHLVEAIGRLREAGRPASLFLAGAPAQSFERLLDTLPPAVRDRVVLLGPVDDADKKDLLAACDLLAMPSRTDSFGIAYLEAWLYRKPVIAARAWGIADIVADGQNGLLVPFGDVAGLAEAIRQLIGDPARRAALGERGEKMVYERYTWEHVYDRVRDIYQNLTPTPGRPTIG